MRIHFYLALGILSLGLVSVAYAAEVLVKSRSELMGALESAKPGTTIKMAAGNYAGGIRIQGLRGTAESPITLSAESSDARPLIEGGQSGLQLSECAHVVLKELRVKGATGNGINIDDGGKGGAGTHHITLDGIEVFERTHSVRKAYCCFPVAAKKIGRDDYRNHQGTAADMAFRSP